MMRRGGRTAVAVAVVLLAVTGAALAALNGDYRGKTSQNQPVSFKILSGHVRNFRIVVNEACPDGHILSATETFPTMKITGGRFGGSFIPVAAHPGEHASLHGTLEGRGVTGTIRDTGFSHREQKLCEGSATWRAQLL